MRNWREEISLKCQDLTGKTVKERIDNVFVKILLVVSEKCLVVQLPIAV